MFLSETQCRSVGEFDNWHTNSRFLANN